jgi:hypothetical protein
MQRRVLRIAAVAHCVATQLLPPLLAGKLGQRLAELHLHENHLTVLPRELARLLSLMRLTCAGNPLVHPPLEVAKKGPAAVRAFLSSGVVPSTAQVS